MIRIRRMWQVAPQAMDPVFTNQGLPFTGAVGAGNRYVPKYQVLCRNRSRTPVHIYLDDSWEALYPEMASYVDIQEYAALRQLELCLVDVGEINKRAEYWRNASQLESDPNLRIALLDAAQKAQRHAAAIESGEYRYADM